MDKLPRNLAQCKTRKCKKSKTCLRSTCTRVSNVAKQDFGSLIQQGKPCFMFIEDDKATP